MLLTTAVLSHCAIAQSTVSTHFLPCRANETTKSTKATKKEPEPTTPVSLLYSLRITTYRTLVFSQRFPTPSNASQGNSENYVSRQDAKIAKVLGIGRHIFLAFFASWRENSFWLRPQAALGSSCPSWSRQISCGWALPPWPGPTIRRTLSGPVSRSRVSRPSRLCLAPGRARPPLGFCASILCFYHCPYSLALLGRIRLRADLLPPRERPLLGEVQAGGRPEVLNYHPVMRAGRLDLLGERAEIEVLRT